MDGNEICGRGGIGRLGGFRCCHLSVRFAITKNSGSLTLPLIYAGMVELVDTQDLGAVTSV